MALDHPAAAPHDKRSLAWDSSQLMHWIWSIFAYITLLVQFLKGCTVSWPNDPSWNPLFDHSLCRSPHRPEQAAINRIKNDLALRQAYETSEKTGDLLLKSEGQELEYVNKYADELLQKQYRSAILYIRTFSQAFLALSEDWTDTWIFSQWCMANGRTRYNVR